MLDCQFYKLDPMGHHLTNLLFHIANTLLLFALGLMPKPMLVTLPFVLLLLDHWPLGCFKSREPNRAWVGWKLAWEKASLLVLSAASSVVTYLAQL